MRDAIEWDEADILSLIKEKVQESLTLDHKKSDALGKADRKKNELSKDASAFANSAGGVILYGMEEDQHYPTKPDDGLDLDDISKEWIEQVINSTVHPRIDGLRVNQIALNQSSPGRVIYAVSIPAATSRAPHQAADKRYYKRYNFQSVPLEDYEIRDILRRASIPDLWLNFRFDAGTTTQVNFVPEKEVSEPISLFVDIGNRSQEPAFYYVVNIFIDELLTPFSMGGCTPRGMVKTAEGRSLKSFAKSFGIPGNLPVFSETMFTLFEPPIMFTIEKNTLQKSDFYLGYDIRAPGCTASKIVHVIQRPRGTLWIINQADP
jgi:hypothetical protein